VTAISAGEEHACALADGAAYCWGRNVQGTLGDGTTADRYAAVRVQGLPASVTALAAGGAHTCASVSGAAYCWGSDLALALGSGSSAGVTPNPASIPGLPSTITALAAGTWHTCGLADGAVYCWGANVYGQLGNGTEVTGTGGPNMVVGLTPTVTTIAAGPAQSCALTAGTAYCWGTTSYDVMKTLPEAVPGLSQLTAIAAGSMHACAWAAGNVYCWGDNARGQLGDGSTVSSLTPVRVALESS
jgi:alpha-tubulin suppressor-like RCC1 family protein